MAAIDVESVEYDSPANDPEDSGHISWNNSLTRMRLTNFKDNPVLWNKQLKGNANRQKTKKAMALLLRRHNHQETWRRSNQALRYMKSK